MTMYRGPGSVYRICQQMGISEYSEGVGLPKEEPKEELIVKYKRYMEYLVKNPPQKVRQTLETVMP